MKVQAFNPPDFRHQGACRGEDPELFFPIGDTSDPKSPAYLQAQESKEICGYCPVIDQCRKWAFETNQQHGTWGGLTEQERRSLKRKENRERRQEQQKPAVQEVIAA